MTRAIEVTQLSKMFRIGCDPASSGNDLRESLTQWLTTPWKRLRAGRADGAATKEFWALRDVSFDIRDGEVIGVIGRNGAGKSTLLKILSRIAEPTSGRATIRGRVASLLEVGTGFHQELSGRENIFLNGAILGMSRREIERKLDEIIAFSGVEQFLDTPVKRYSSGMRVRLGFAVAAHLEPDILIIDEVLAVGDVGFQRKCLGKMDSIAKSGRTILFVSHNMAAVRTHCSRGLLFEQGQLAADGPIDDVVGEYNALMTESFVERRDSINGDAELDERFRLHYGESGNHMTIECGAPLSLEFEIEAPHRLKELSLGVTVFARGGEPVMGMSSKVQAIPPSRGDARRWRARVDFGRIPLNAADYSLRIYVGDGVRDVARFSNAYCLTVAPYDVHGWGNALPPTSSWGYTHWAPDWCIEPHEPTNSLTPAAISPATAREVVPTSVECDP